jgi:cation diffusion facilitator family transporter
MNPNADSKDRLKAAWISLLMGVVMLVVKMGAYLLTGSHAILSDAMESVVHILATGFVVYCIIYSNQPADEDHPYGHGKIEGFSVGFEGGLIFLAGLCIIWEAGVGLYKGHQTSDLEMGMVLIGSTAVLNVVLGLYLIKMGKKHNSAILKADGKHIMSDAVTSIGVIVGVFLVIITQLTWLDSAIAFAVALHLLYTGFTLMREAAENLMDRVDTNTLESIVATLNRLKEPDWKDVHLLRVHKNGNLHHIDFHMVIPSSWSVARAHDVMDHIEANILKDLGTGGSVLIHLDPELDPDLQKLQTKVMKDPLAPFTVEKATRPVRDPKLELIRQGLH